jgi:hypothetical protein
VPSGKKRMTATAEAIAALIRIYRSAVASGDDLLAKSTSVSLERYGIRISDLIVNPNRSAGTSEGSSSNGGAK